MGGRDFVGEAIKSVRELLINQLEEGNYCGAKRVGEALERLINLKAVGVEAVPSGLAMQGNYEQERR